MFKFFPLRGGVLAAALMLLSLFSCHKDFQPPLPEHPQPTATPNYPITLFEAMAHFAELQDAPASSFSDETKFIELNPVWQEAGTSQSQSGKDIVVVPLADSSLRVLNSGRVDAKLLFSKDGPDEITAEILVYVADSAYHAANNGNFSLSNFTGSFSFYDIGQNFLRGVYVEDGEPVGKLDSVSMYIQGVAQVEDRYDNDCCEQVSVIYRVKCYPELEYDQEVFCYITEHFTVCHCTDIGGGGGTTGGTTGSTSGGTTGGTNNGGTNGGTSGNNNDPYGTFWDVFFGRVPMGIFTNNPSILPPGFDTTLVRNFIDIHGFFRFTPKQLENLQKRPDFIAVLHDVYADWFDVNYDPEQPDGRPDFALAKPVLDFAVKHKLTAAQFEALLRNGVLFGHVKSLAEGLNLNDNSVKWLVGNSEAAKGINLFHVNYDGLEGADEAAKMLLDYAVANNITNPFEANFEDYGENAFNCGPCFAAAWSIEYAILKKFEPCPPGDWACDWQLRAKATWNVISTGVHVMLDIAGLVPVYGEIFDVTNGVIYSLEGNYADAVLSGASAVPFLGWTATTAKYAIKVVNLAGNSMQLKYVLRSDGIIIFGENVESARKQLRTMLKTPSGYQAHHIIPWELYDHPVVQTAADLKIDGFHLNELLNGISLPTSAGNLPKHLGSHPDYTTRVRQSLDQIEANLGNNMSPADAAQELRELIQSINTKIRATSGGSINDVSGW